MGSRARERKRESARTCVFWDQCSAADELKPLEVVSRLAIFAAGFRRSRTEEHPKKTISDPRPGYDTRRTSFLVLLRFRVMFERVKERIRVGPIGHRHETRGTTLSRLSTAHRSRD